MLNIKSFLLYLFYILVSLLFVVQAFSNNIGPQTTPVKLDGYLERDTYHEIRYVSQTKGADREGNGTKENPWATIQHALTQIVDARLSNRYAILVAEGNYAESTINLKEYVSLYGGFDNSTWSRDITVHKTILDGEGRNRVLIGAHHAKVDGFVIRRGVVRGRGGAILCDGTSPVISNNVFTQNKTLAPVPWDPEFLHEVAHDGAAIAADNGASPVVKNNLFFQNSTETGRGGGIACHNNSSPEIVFNIFVDNVAGTADPRRSSDGGAVSAALYSNPTISNNILICNRALTDNDGGGIFSELWSSPIIDGNYIVGNYADDDGGGIYISGQKHHYITQVDAIPPEERFFVYVRNNVIMGNATSGKEDANHGVLRSTNDNRMVFENNLIAESIGGIDFRRSEINVRNNTLIADILVRESDHPANFVNNLIIGDLIQQSAVVLDETEVMSKDKVSDEILFTNLFVDDSMSFEVKGVSFNEDRYVSLIRLSDAKIKPDELRYRIVKSGDRWGVIKHNDESTITVWGNFPDSRDLGILPTYTIDPSSEIYKKGLGHR